jgi:hypothetical protein
MVRKAGLQVVGTYHYGVLPILDEKSRVPEGLVNLIEEKGSRVSSLESASKYVIYVCKKDLTIGRQKFSPSYTL